MRICSGPGCLRAVPDDVRFCDECKPKAAIEDGISEHTITDRVRYAFLYSSARWQRLRARVVREQPMCARCGRQLTAIVDHVVPAGVAVAQARESKSAWKWWGFFLRSNLQGLCRACHLQKTIEDKTHTGPWPDVVAREARTEKRRWTF